MAKPLVPTQSDTSGISLTKSDGVDLFRGLARQVIQHSDTSRGVQKAVTQSTTATSEPEDDALAFMCDQPQSWNAQLIWQHLAFVPNGMRPALAAIALETSRLLVNEDYTAFLSPQLSVLWEDSGGGIEVSIALIRSVRELRESSLAPSPGWRAEALRLLHEAEEEEAGDA